MSRDGAGRPVSLDHEDVSGIRIHAAQIEWLIQTGRLDDARRELNIVRDHVHRLGERLQKRRERVA